MNQEDRDHSHYLYDIIQFLFFIIYKTQVCGEQLNGNESQAVQNLLDYFGGYDEFLPNKFRW